MTRRVNDAVLARIQSFEGRRLTAYRDPAGILTIGYGHTGPDVVPGRTITAEEAEALLRDDLGEAEAAVERLVAVPLTDPQFGALVSLVFNIGTQAFERSRLRAVLNQGRYDAVPGELMRWNKATLGGRKVVLPGLAHRRAAEAGLWASGAFVSGSTVAVAPVTAAAPLATPEAMAGAASVGVTVFGAASQGGPLAWALAFGLVVVVALGAVRFARRLAETPA